MGTKNNRQKRRKKMQQKDLVEELKNGIQDIWEETRNNIASNIIRGHSRSISTDVEDMIALFISKEFDNKVKIFIDPSITIRSKTYRPDLLVIRNDEVIALVEIKANLGWCRDASIVIEEELVTRQKVFSEAGQIECKFSITKTSETVSLDEYLTMIRKKTAVLLAGALKIGSLYADCDEIDRNHLYEFGINIGVAFQLQDDLLDAFGDEKTFGKPIGTDIKDNKKTFLFLKAMEQASDTDKNILKEWFSQIPENNQEKISSVLKLYNKLNIRDITENEIERYFSKGLQELDLINVATKKKEPLRSFVNQLLGRKY